MYSATLRVSAPCRNRLLFCLIVCGELIEFVCDDPSGEKIHIDFGQSGCRTNKEVLETTFGDFCGRFGDGPFVLLDFCFDGVHGLCA